MEKYVEVNEVIEVVNRAIYEGSDIISAIQQMEPAKICEVIYGHWKFYNGYITCSICGEQPYKDSINIDFDNLWKICPGCGARMD